MEDNMNYVYTWVDAEKTTLKREDQQGQAMFIGANSNSRGWKEYVKSGATAADYVAPPEPAPLTTEEKLNAAGLTVEELRTLFGLPEPLPADEPAE
jgi:hypothetical protein